MHSETSRIADQLRRAFAGDAWHGPPLRELLEGVTAEQACRRPLPSGHTIWELVLHIEIYLRVAAGATQGTPLPRVYQSEMDWRTPADTGAAAWADATGQLFEGGAGLARAIEEFPEARLQDIVPGREYDFYYLFHGIVQH